MRAAITLFTSLCVVLAVFTACQQKPAQPKPKPTVSAEEVKQKVGAAVSVTKDYALQQSAEYRQELEQKLKEIDKQLAAWQPQIEAATAAAKAKLEKELAELEKQRQLVQQKLQELQEPGQKAWNDVKAGTEAAMNELEKAFRKAAERFQK